MQESSQENTKCNNQVRWIHYIGCDRIIEESLVSNFAVFNGTNKRELRKESQRL